jgi:hypothetical protein
VTAVAVAPRWVPVVGTKEVKGWDRGDTASALGWFALALMARAPFMAWIESVLDHDQSIVGLMALDIAAGRRLPIFFDGQRYMGALEPYVAALFVVVFGHSPVVVALAPWLFFGLFTAGQYALWRCWGDRITGHLAALIAVLGAPMLVLWSIVPRGGYIELLAWAVPVLGVYRAWTRPHVPAPTRGRQAAWGFLFLFGYFLNPLSLIVYLTLAIDWTFGRHGAELRRARGGLARWVDARGAPLFWILLGGGLILALAVCCHVDMNRDGGAGSLCVFALDRLPGPWGPLLGTLGIAGLLVGAAWWSGLGELVVRRVSEHMAFAFGALLALTPFGLHGICVSLGMLPFAHSLPIWFRAPWDVTPNLHDGLGALGTLIGCSPEGAATVLIGQGIESPPHVVPLLSRGLAWFSPVQDALVGGLIASTAWRDRRAWRRLWSLRGEEPTPPTVLAVMFLAVTAILYLCQATSLNASSVRYLVPAWIVLPGLIAAAIRALPRPGRWAWTLLLLVPWGVAQANLRADLCRASPLRPLADALVWRGARGIIADKPVALTLVNLTGGRVGALEYRTQWRRLDRRYDDRFVPGETVLCVNDPTLTWSLGPDRAGKLHRDLGDRLGELARRYPDRVRRAWRIDHFEVWEVDLPVAEILDRDALPLPSGSTSAKLSGVSPTGR